jgi:hypothetical protein
MVHKHLYKEVLLLLQSGASKISLVRLSGFIGYSRSNVISLLKPLFFVEWIPSKLILYFLRAK